MENSVILEKVKSILGHQLCCVNPFENLAIDSYGDVFFCCPVLVNFYKIGNILEDEIDEIWNGEKAQKFRETILNGTFNNCCLTSCLDVANIFNDYRFLEKVSKYSKIMPYPKKVELNIDTICNVRCITCRDKNNCNSEFTNKFAEIIDSKLVPLMQNAETVYIDGAGEVFASKLCKNLIKKITQTYPNIKFQIITNGILATEDNIKEFGLDGHIKSMEVSIHAATKATYEKIVRGGDFDAVMKNLRTFSKMQKENKIEFINMNYVVSSYNYKEMIDFQKLADELGAYTRFWEYRKWGNAELDNHYDEVAIFEPTHPDYDKYLEVVKNFIFDNSNCSITNKLRP